MFGKNKNINSRTESESHLVSDNGFIWKDATNQRKGFVFTTDAIIAIIVSGVILLATLGVISSIRAPEPEQKMWLDMLSVLESKGGNITENARVLIRSVPERCADFRVRDSGGVLVGGVYSGCECEKGYSVYARTYIEEGETVEERLMELRVCRQ